MDTLGTDPAGADPDRSAAGSAEDTLRVTTGSDPDGTPVLTLAGELDLTGTARAEAALAALPTPVAGQDTDVVIDVTELTFMDSAGLTVLLVAARRGHAVRLRRPTPIVRHLIAATGLSGILPIEP